MASLIDLILHVDEHLMTLAVAYGPWIYALLFAVVFAETGLVVTPLLPGDSLLFAAGALAGAGILDPVLVATLLMAAAIGGDAVNYSVGRAIGPRVFAATDTTSRLHRLLNREHLNQAHAFFERHERLIEIDGIGPVLASKIIQNRPYESEQELIESKELPPSAIESLRKAA